MGKYDPQRASSMTWSNHGEINIANELANMNLFFATRELYEEGVINSDQWKDFLIKYSNGEIFEGDVKVKKVKT